MERKIEVEAGDEWVVSGYKTWNELKDAGWKFEYLEHDNSCVVMSRKGYIDRFRNSIKW